VNRFGRLFADSRSQGVNVRRKKEYTFRKNLAVLNSQDTQERQERETRYKYNS
jgi:hypothetical protein